MRVATLFKRLLRLGRERVVGVELEDEDGIEKVIVTVALRERRAMRCSGCSSRIRSAYDTRPASRRHLDLGRVRCVIACEVRRVCCPGCGIRAEAVPWARPGSRFTRAFEDTAVYLVKHAPKSTVAALMRVDWHTVGRMIERVVAEHASTREGDGLDGLVSDRHRRGRLPQGPPLPDVRLRPRLGGAGVGEARQKPGHRRDPLRRARPGALRAAAGGVARSSRRLGHRHPPPRPRCPHLRRPVPCHQARRRRPGPGPP